MLRAHVKLLNHRINGKNGFIPLCLKFSNFFKLELRKELANVEGRLHDERKRQTDNDGMSSKILEAVHLDEINNVKSSLVIAQNGKLLNSL
jgi:hypothetical protein